MRILLKFLPFLLCGQLVFSATKFDDEHLDYWKQTAKTNTYPKLRKNAAWMLGKLGDTRAVPALIEVTQQDQDPSVRGIAATSLGRIGSPSAIEPLMYMMNNDADKTARNMARQAIDRIYQKINLKKAQKEKLGRL